MFTCAKIMNGSSYLGNHLTANDYYCENEHVEGKWVGKGAEKLSLAGKPIGKDDAAFEAVRRNLRPDGSGKLTSRTALDGVRFFDFQCSAQKSVSIMAATLEDGRLYAAHDTATAKAFAELERFAAFRSGRTREPMITGNLCAAAFRHMMPLGRLIPSFTPILWLPMRPGILIANAGLPWILAKCLKPFDMPGRFIRTNLHYSAGNWDTRLSIRAMKRASLKDLK
jgi:hypothetical protein